MVNNKDLWKWIDEGNLEPGDEPPSHNRFMEFVQDHPGMTFAVIVAVLLAWTHFGGGMMDRFLKWVVK